MEHVKPVVAAVDGSDSALGAVRWAAAYATRARLPLRLVHVSVPPVAFPSEALDPSVMRGAIRKQGHRWLGEARDAVEEVSPGLAPRLVLETAPVVPVLVKESLGASVLVLGTRGLGGFTGLLLGSTAVLLAGRAHCPLVVVRGTEDALPDGPVVVGVDGLPTSEAAVAFAFAEADRLGAELVAVHAWRDAIADTVLFGHQDTPDFAPTQQQAYETLAERLAGWQEKYPSVRVHREVVRDHPSSAMARYAERARLVVVGTRGRGGFRGLVLGSTGQHLLHHAPCPVAMVRTDPAP